MKKGPRSRDQTLDCQVYFITLQALMLTGGFTCYRDAKF